MPIEWGREIPVDGKRPAWLADDVSILWKKPDNTNFNGVCSAANHNWSGTSRYPVASTHIKLPVDHFAYLALDKGFEPWGGGDEAPADWDGGETLLRGGSRRRGAVLWGNEPHRDCQVIGYRKRVEPVEGDPQALASKALAALPDFVAVKRMTREEAMREARAHVRGFTACTHFVLALETLGLIREETPLERFARETGTVVDDSNRAAIERALSWDRAA